MIEVYKMISESMGLEYVIFLLYIQEHGQEDQQ